MRFLTYLFFFETFILSFANAQPVNIQTASMVACNYTSLINTSFFLSVNSTPNIYPAYYRIIKNDTLYYVFNVDTNGFIIVSGDYSTVPILGYSNESSYAKEPKPAAFEFWLDNYATQIEQSSTSHINE